MDWTWLITAIATVGVVLNAQQRVSCFYWWIVSNCLWIYVDVRAGLYGQAGMFVLYLGMCFYGIITWNKKAK
jgi:nicotinamide mononucleotide transporter